MRRFYALGVLGATAVAAALGLKVTEARAHPCPVPECLDEWLYMFNCGSDICDNRHPTLRCGYCIP